MSLMDSLLLDPYGIDPSRAEVWISPRTDGVLGSGTENDPYDGTTRTTPVIAVTSISSVQATATVTAPNHGLQNGQLVLIAGATGVDANLYNGGFSIFNATSNTFQYTMLGEPQSSTAGGTLTCQRTPYLFDLMMNSFAANTCVHLGPGTLSTLGFSPSASGWMPKSGFKIGGSGMDVTVLKLVGAAIDNGGNYLAIGSSSHNLLTSLEAFDLTIDCNVQGQTSQLVSCGAISITGAHNRLRRIRAINFGTQTWPIQTECFVLQPTFANADLGSDVFVDCWIDNCIVEQPGLGNALETTILSIGGGENSNFQTAYHRGCVIRNCFLDCEYRQNPVSISQISVSVAGVATVTTRLKHGHQNGDYVRISGVLINGSTNNSFNGSYTITNASDYNFDYTPTPSQSQQTINTGDMWLGRFPSQYISIQSMAKAGSGPYTITVTTDTPHFLVPWQMVAIQGSASPPDPTPPPVVHYKPPNGYRQVLTIPSPTQFTYQVNDDPGSPITVSSAFTGVSFQGCSADVGTAAVVEGNRFLNAIFGGPYQDTWSSKDMTVRNNYHRGVLTGPYENRGGADTTLRPCTLINTVTITTLSASAHNLLQGETVQVTGVLPITSFYNGNFTVLSATADQLTYQMAGDPLGPPPSGSPMFARLWQVGRLTFENNVIELLLSIFIGGSQPPTGVNFFNAASGSVQPPIYLIAQIVIRRNVIHSLDGAHDVFAYPVGIRPWSCGKGVVEESVIDLNSISGGPPIWQVQCGSMAYLNNQTSSGGLIQGWISETRQFVEEVATIVDLALIQSL